jgi:hypothetical protein
MTPTNHLPRTTPQAINPHAARAMSLVALGKSLSRNRQLIVQMTKHEAMGRYKGSIMGVAWSFFNPVFMLVVYTFVFSVIFNSRLDVGAEESKTQFTVVLFVGMIMLSLFNEVMNRVPGLILSNVNYIKKDAFPLVISLTVLSGGWPSWAIPARCGASHRHHYHHVDVSLPRSLIRYQGNGKILPVYDGQPAYLRHRASARSADLGVSAELDGFGWETLVAVAIA